VKQLEKVKCMNRIIKEHYNKTETYNQSNELHSFDDNPAITYFSGDKYWFKNGKIHRDNGPARILIYKSLIVKHFYCQDGLYHRVAKPAYIEWKDGIKIYEAYYIKGNRHNLEGPAETYYFPYYNRKFYVDSNQLSLDDFIKQFEKILNV